MYKRLRNLEVNSTKRFVTLTHQVDDSERAQLRRRAFQEAKFGSGKEGQAANDSSDDIGFEFQGLSTADQLTFAYAESLGLDNSKTVYDAFLQHYQELVLLISDYKKPLIHLQIGKVMNEAVPLIRFSNMSAISHTTQIEITNFRDPNLLFGGLSLLLAQHPIALFSALTSVQLKGVDILYAGLADHLMCQEAINMLEMTAEKISFETTEADGRELLLEHSLEWPEPSNWFKRRGDEISKLLLGMDGFGAATFGTIFRSLSYKTKDTAFLANLQSEIRHLQLKDPAVFSLNWALIQHAGKVRRRILSVTLNDKALNDHLLSSMGSTGRAAAGTDSQSQFMESRRRQKLVDFLTLQEVLQAELKAQEMYRRGMVKAGDTVMGKLKEADSNSELSESDIRSLDDEIARLTSEVLEKLDSDEINLGEPKMKLDTITSRTDISLSKHPLLRQCHPDYNEKTRADHDPRDLEREAERFSEGYLREEIFQIKKRIVPETVERYRF